MGKLEARLDRILELFKKSKSIALETLMKEFNVTDRTIKSDISKLRQRGINIDVKDGIYSYSQQENFSRVNSIEKKDIRNSIILQTISENRESLNRLQLIDMVLKKVVSSDSLSYKTLERAINALEDNHIIHTNKNGKYDLSLDTEVIYSIPKEDIYKFCYYQNIYGKDFPFNKTLKSVSRKFDTIINQGNPSEDDFEDDRFITLGRSFNDDEIIINIIKKLEVNNYAKNSLELKYITNRNYIMTVHIDVVALLYNWDKDKTYIAGLTSKGLTLIDVKKVQSIKALNFENMYFMDKPTLERLEIMFSAAVDGPYKIKVRFQNIYNIKEKIEKLKQIRKTASISENEGFFIYEDIIYGLYDFASFLRRFGRSCEVLEPKELRNIMRETYKKILESYEV